MPGLARARPAPWILEPGATVAPAYAAQLAASLHNCKLVRLGAGIHNLQEDHPAVIGQSVAEWIDVAHSPH